MLEQLAENVWVVEGACVNFHGFAYPTRSVIIRLKSGQLWVWSPVELTDDLAAQVEKIGRPAYLIAPNKIHHLYLSDWHERHPEAEVWGPRALQKKRPDITFAGDLDHGAPPSWQSEFQTFHAKGSLVMNEHLFFHRPSKTLIVADFSEHLSEDFLQTNWRPWQRLMAQFWGIVVGKGYAPLDWRLSFLRRGPLRLLREQLIALAPNRVIMAHGERVNSNTVEFLRKALSWI